MRFKISFGLLLLFFSTSAFTADIIINVTGRIKNESCTIKTDDQNQTILIGHFQVRDFPQTGSVSESAPLNISLENCTESASGAIITFSGSAAAQNSALLALTDNDNSENLASGIGIEILDAETEKAIAINKPAPVKKISAENNILKYLLRYKSVNSNVTAGNASAIMYFDIVYQ